MKLYSIRDWDLLYENNRTRTVKDLPAVLIRNRHEGENFNAIMAHPDGATIFSAFILLVQVASRCQPRGTLITKTGRPHDAASLSAKCHCPVKWLTVALPYLENNTDWLTVTELRGATPLPVPLTPQPPAAPSPNRPLVVTAPAMSPPPPPGDPTDHGHRFTLLQSRLNAIYGVDRRWTYAEESMLAELARFPGSEAELTTILAFRGQLPVMDRARFFPQSVLRLLEKWSEILDRAKLATARPDRTGPPRPDKLIADQNKL